MDIKTKEILKYILAFIFVLTALVLIWGLLIKEVPESNRDLFNIALGIVLGGFTTVKDFFFGSSNETK